MCFMRKLSCLLVAVALSGCFATVGPDGRAVGGEVSFSLGLPVILPPLVVIQPGVSVVSDLDQEVFFADGYYWARQDQSWYRSHDHRSNWARVEDRHVPPAIAHSPPGQYRRYQGNPPHQGERGPEKHQHGGGDDHG
jgi:hypothetical protein